jgi:hypothetical protein
MAKNVWTRLDGIMRWLHLYTALFLTPWMIVYATSAFCLNHNQRIRELLHIVPPKWEAVEEVSFVPDDTFPVSPEDQARAILREVDLQGPHRIQGKRTPQQLLIFRFCGRGNYRITWQRQQAKILVEQQQPFSALRLVHYLHFRGGYGQPYPTMILWAIIVDAVAISMWLWVITGIYLWARRPKKRKLGTVCLVAGCLLFAGLVLMLCA